MVFENLTLFEVHLEDATFSPTQILGEGEADDERPAGSDDRAAANEHEEPTDGNGWGRVLALVVASLVVSVVIRKLVGDAEEPEVDIDAPEEPVDVSLDG
ncbi:hypothetical protein [Halorhabdus amylolytica]|uniref:hypothetical protein n=1 Tax=Halorhabdus amylolytica TaxID=2559573 RepID=UPI0010AA9CCE|nr:hypothetical protein [Halorhabdus amylolytica]